MNLNEQHISEQLRSGKERHHAPPIVDDLEMRIKRVFRANKRKVVYQKISTAVAILMILLVASANINESFAITLSEIPILGKVVQVFSFRFDAIDTENVHANVETPVITGLDNETLQSALNEKYYEENKTLYDTFVAEVGDITALGGHMGFDSGYEIKTNTDEILSIGRYYVNTAGSSSTTFSFDTIDKIEGIMITLPSLFKDQTYVTRISDYLIQHMKEEMIADPDKMYWVNEGDIDTFKSIKTNQNFYITAEGKLMISFDKYEVGPGVMGIVEFEIPTDVISDLLVSDKYIH